MPKKAPLRIRVKELRHVAAAELRENPQNWRRHPKRQREALKGVLNEIGFVGAVLARELEDGSLELLDGHLRTDVVGKETIPVLILDLNDDEVKTFLLTFDPITALATMDTETVQTMLKQTAIPEDLTDFFRGQMEDVQEIIDRGGNPIEDLGVREPKAPEEPEPKPVTEDKPPEPVAEPVVQLGDLWVCGEHRVLCGDSREAESYERLMQGEKVGCILTDPPYGIDLNTDFSSMKGSEKFRREKGVTGGLHHEKITGDSHPFNAQETLSLVGNPTEQLWFGADYYASTLGNTGSSGAWLVWDKRIDAQLDKGFGSCFELIYSKKKRKREILRHKWFGVFGTEQELERKRYHPTQKPTSLIIDLLKRIDNSLIVLDPFLGSGTTMIAAEQLGRRCFGIEIEPKYVQVSLTRWRNLTGKEPVRESDRKTLAELEAEQKE